ncbi:putative E3 ubiquitin-protein ligase LOG2 [Acorus calamus]|uniref:E3 ubiquitin-protein ligase LOG2 n=1 Tax=Acorus calamus TaxID=4465 RepID=A0AAV9CNG5_ACOCL|nr:putative E3 ubiquitin-protein ligase LOG2 [Acorus calamus]
MAQMTHEALPIPTFNLPLFEPAQGGDFSPLCDLGSWTMYNNNNNQVVNGNMREILRTRKRGREEDIHINVDINAIESKSYGSSQSPSDHCLCCPSFSMGGDLSTRMQREQQELDHFILMQTEKTRVELEMKRRRHCATVLRVVEDGMLRVLSGKDEEIAIMARKNSALEEEVRVLEMQGQIWKTLAQNNEATLTALREDLENARNDNGAVNGDAEDSASSCHVDDGRYCRGCHKRDISVLVLPCRHLCLCGECDRVIDTCPVCMGAKSASIQVRLS